MNLKIISVIVAAILVVSGVGIFLFLSDDAKGERVLTSTALEIYGNADGNSKIDEDDAKLVEEYIRISGSGTSDEIDDFITSKKFNTKFADANNDGKIDGADVTQIRDIVKGVADTLWLVDGEGNDRSIDLDISRIGAEYYANTELCLVLGLADKVVAVDNAPYIYKDFYFTKEQQKNLVNLQNMFKPDYDYVNGLDLDILLTFTGNTDEYGVKQEKIIGADVVYLGLYNPDMSDAESSNFIQGILKAGYIFGVVDRAEEYATWILDTRDRLADIASTIPEDQKKTVLMSNYQSSYFIDPDIKTATVYCFTDPLGQACLLGGCKNVGEILAPDYKKSRSYKSQVDALFSDDESITIDYIFLHMVKHTYGGTTLAGVPDHGYLTESDVEISEAWKSATSSEHTLLVDMNPNDLYLLAGDFRNGPTGAVMLGAYIGNIVNPDYYSSVDPTELHNHYINYWLGISDYDVSEDGVFIYHAYA
ncbi:MAG: hypothetical protein GX307_07445 [Euryarchaeota archaeon]|nr:hypothetical protein [Euryarchaeota archaeon]